MDLDKPYDRVNKGELWQVLRMYDAGGKLLNGINSMYVDSLACVNLNGAESECFRIDNGMRQGCILAFQCIYERSDEGDEMGMGEGVSEISGRGKRVEIACR